MVGRVLPDIPDQLTTRHQLRIRGVVQGAGFRPYVYNLARRHGLAGFVLNPPRGVFVEVEGLPDSIEAFIAALPADAPPLVRIAAIDRVEMASLGEAEFMIRHSEGGESAFAL